MTTSCRRCKRSGSTSGPDALHVPEREEEGWTAASRLRRFHQPQLPARLPGGLRRVAGGAVLLAVHAQQLEEVGDGQRAQQHAQDAEVLQPRERPYQCGHRVDVRDGADRKSTRLNSSHANISYAVFCLKKKTNKIPYLHTLY